MSRPLVQGPLLLLLMLPLVALAQSAGAMDHPAPDPLLLERHYTDAVMMRGLPMLFLLVMLIAGLVFASARDKRRTELLAKFIERGQEIPAAMLPQANSRQRSLRMGTLLTLGSLALGVGLLATFQDLAFIVWCLVPLSLGIGCFINAAFFHRDPGNGP